MLKRTPPKVEMIGNVGRYHVRRIKRSPDMWTLDLREFVQGSNYSGYTRKGISLAIPKEVEELRTLLDRIQ